MSNRPPPRTVPYEPVRPDDESSTEKAEALLETFSRRRSVRHFASDPIPAGVLEACIRVGATAPSGANKQPWTWVVVRDGATKAKIREAAEEEERAFYEQRAPARWLEDLAHLGTDEVKPFLEVAPALVILFAQKHGAAADERHYYVNESVGIAAGFFLAALHLVGLSALTHTPSPMAFLTKILQRPDHERPFLLMPVGYPAPGCRVPDISRKPVEDVLIPWRPTSG